MAVCLFILVAFLAYANGSNDNCKGVATLVGYGAATPRRALFYGTVTTALGAGVSFWSSRGLLKSFSTGLFAAGTPLTQGFFVAVLMGAFCWVMLATFTGLPVSTTHAITGSLIGAGVVTFGRSAVQWQALGKGFLVPLGVSPLLSLGVVYLLAWPVVWVVGRAAARCVCITQEPVATVTGGLAVAAMRSRVIVGTSQECDTRATVAAVGVSAAANAVHWVSGGLIGFARGWNDAPKIAALCLIALPHNMGVGFAIVTMAMAAGGWVSGRGVLETLSKKLTPLPLSDSLTASLATAALVCMASWQGLPVSTTHVSTGAIIGAGLKRDPRGVKWRKVGEIILSWALTLPVAGLLAAAASRALR